MALGNSFSLANKKILVTGAGRGLGASISKTLVAQGAHVWGTSRDPGVAQQLARELGTAPMVLDQNDVGSIAGFVKDLMDVTGGIDGVVNNAGINRPKPSLEVSVDDWDIMLNTNVRGPFFLTQEIARRWLDQGSSGRVVNIASQAGIVAVEDRSPYGASKAALIHLTKSLAAEWATSGIRVNAIAPTFVRTEMTKGTLDNPQKAERLLSRIPAGRFGEPQDLHGATIFLLSEASEFMTGQTLIVDGGYTLR